MKRTLGQNKRLYGLLNELGITPEQKELLVQSFTGERETSSSKMRPSECDALIKHLTAMRANKNAVVDSVENKMRRKILSICREMGTDWYNQEKYNWKKINAWLLKYGYLHKPLNDYTAKELPKLITQFENLLASYYAKR